MGQKPVGRNPRFLTVDRSESVLDRKSVRNNGVLGGSREDPPYVLEVEKSGRGFGGKSHYKFNGKSGGCKGGVPGRKILENFEVCRKALKLGNMAAYAN